MSVVIWMVAALALIGATVLTGVIRKAALVRGVIDVPNERSSHLVPTPRGGGLAIVLTVSTAVVVLYALGLVGLDLTIAFVGGGLAVATVGFLDDHRPLPARLRLAVHFAAAVWALGWLGGMPSLRFGDEIVVFGWGGFALGAVGIVWVLNLFNFMDGIDGIAASEAIFVTWGGAIVAMLAGTSGDVIHVAIVFGAACLGFLRWNWPKARIFMGDVGSGYIGFSLAVLTIAATRKDGGSLFTWLLLGGIFFLDATVTLLRRLCRGERVADAHRTHAYQWLARRWASHERVTLLTIGVNLFWLLPWSLVLAVHASHTGVILFIALAPVTVGVVAAGGGRAER